MNEGVMGLVLEAQEKFQKAVTSNEDIVLITGAQGDVLADLLESLADPEKIHAEMSDLEERCAKVDKQILNAQELLLEMMTEPERTASDGRVGGLLKTVIDTTLKVLFGHVETAVTEGQTHVSLLHILDVEDQLAKLIADMERRNMYPETDKQREERMLHNQRVVQFLELVKAASLQQ